MNFVTNGPSILLGFALLADVAPVGSSGCGCDSDPAPRVTQLAVLASDCSCAPNPITVNVDGSNHGTVSCGTGQPLYVLVSADPHEVSATSSDGTWATRRVMALGGQTVQVDLGCPTR